MKICDLLPQVLAKSFASVAFISEYDKELSVSINWDGTAATKLLLSEVLSSEVLKRKLFHYNGAVLCESAVKSTKNSEDDQNKLSHIDHETGECQTKKADLKDDNQNETTENQIKKLYDFYVLYLHVLKGIPHTVLEDPLDYNMKIKESMNNVTDIDKHLEEAHSMDVPTIYLNLNFDATLVFRMRQDLWIEINEKLNLEMLEDMLRIYEFFMFDENSVTDVFLRFSDNKTEHLKIKCSILFGLNLHCLLHKQGMLEDFMEMVLFKNNKGINFNKRPVPNIFNSNFAANFGHLESLKFIEPLFRLIKIDYNEDTKEPVSIDFIDELTDMRYRIGERNSIELYTHSKESYYEHLAFLDIINEESLICRNTVELTAIIPDQIKSDLAAIFVSLLKLCPQIKTLNLANVPGSSYSNMRTVKSTYFDRLIDSVLGNKKTISRLTGLVVDGITHLSSKTAVFLKTCKFEKFGMRGMREATDLHMLFFLFKQESQASAKVLFEKVRIKNKNRLKYEDYNYLRNSVTHLISNEEIARLAVKYYMIENIKTASVYLQTHAKNYNFNKEELKSLKELVKYTNDLKKIRQEPLMLDRLEILLRPYEKDRSDLVLRTFGPPSTLSLYNDLMQRAIPNYSVSKLVVMNGVNYKTEAIQANFIGSFVVSSDVLEITISEWSSKGNGEEFLKYLEVLNFRRKCDILLLNLAPSVFTINKEGTKWYGMDSSASLIIARIYQAYFYNTLHKKMIIRLDSAKIFKEKVAKIQEVIYRTITVEQYVNYLPEDDNTTLEKRITFEIADSFKDKNKKIAAY
ncbi:hypothetical protein ENBRE01_0894 [Enteropsectra breve]|nr:hypothetical protein ENBRE01_0894 [Enteropsectra breve]